MIRILQENDLGVVMQIWLDTNIDAHGFISREYWISNYATVEKMLPHAEIYVYENDDTEQIEGFIGVTDHYIAGIFVKAESQSKGIGKQLLDYVKGRKEELNLSVYQKMCGQFGFTKESSFSFDQKTLKKKQMKQSIE